MSIQRFIGSDAQGNRIEEAREAPAFRIVDAATAEREARERNLYGMTGAELTEARAYYMGAGYASSSLGLAMSWLSDAQELVERGHKDAARVIINRCKYLIEIERDEMARAAR